MAFPVGAYVAAHLAAQRIRKQNNTYSSAASSTYINHSKPYKPCFYHKQSNRFVDYDYHTIYVKGLGTVSIGHSDKIADVRKEIRKEYFEEVVSLYVVLGIMVIGVITAVLYFHLLDPIK